MPVLRIRGFALPDGDQVDLYADGDRWTTDPVTSAALVAEGWLGISVSSPDLAR